jgi:hypothetical protein
MTATITSGVYTITPTIIDGYSSTRASQNVVRTILGSSIPAVSLRPALLRSGTLQLIFGDTGPTFSEYIVVDGIVVESGETPGVDAEAASLVAETLHATGGVFTLSETSRSRVGMTYVVSGNVTRKLDDTTRAVWIVTVDFQEV